MRKRVSIKLPKALIVSLMMMSQLGWGTTSERSDSPKDSAMEFSKRIAGFTVVNKFGLSLNSIELKSESKIPATGDIEYHYLFKYVPHNEAADEYNTYQIEIKFLRPADQSHDHLTCLRVLMPPE